MRSRSKAPVASTVSTVLRNVWDVRIQRLTLFIVILSEAEKPAFWPRKKQQVLCFAQDDNSNIRRESMENTNGLLS
jgi:hypothetical protein